MDRRQGLNSNTLHRIWFRSNLICGRIQTFFHQSQVQLQSASKWNWIYFRSNWTRSQPHFTKIRGIEFLQWFFFSRYSRSLVVSVPEQANFTFCVWISSIIPIASRLFSLEGLLGQSASRSHLGSFSMIAAFDQAQFFSLLLPHYLHPSKRSIQMDLWATAKNISDILLVEFILLKFLNLVRLKVL